MQAALRRQVWVLFMMQGEQVVDNVGKVARVAVPMAAYFGILWTGTFLACRAAGVKYGHAVTQVRMALATCCLPCRALRHHLRALRSRHVAERMCGTPWGCPAPCVFQGAPRASNSSGWLCGELCKTR